MSRRIVVEHLLAVRSMLLLLLALLCIPGAYAQVTVVNAGFEFPALPNSDYRYNVAGAGVGWVFPGNTGIQSNGSGWSAPNAAGGRQTAFITGQSYISQAINFASSGTYTVSFWTAQGTCCNAANPQKIRVSIDGSPQSFVAEPTNNSGFVSYTYQFTVAAGTRTLTFAGVVDDNVTAFIDSVAIVPSGKPVRVYMIDSGVGYHSGLPNVTRYSYSSIAGAPVVGCYPHATHVAGIINQTSNGAPIVSVAVAGDSVGGTDLDNLCGLPSSASADNIYSGLNKIYSLIKEYGQVGVINISMNTKGTFAHSPASGPDIAAYLKFLATPTGAPNYYPGAFIVQSAGNQFESACNYAYDGRADGPNDGIMVVGALDQNGQPVVHLNSRGGFRNEAALGQLAFPEPSSNFGPCVDVWAPGNNIRSTWAAGYPGLVQSGKKTYNDYINLSGTSMAAPYVAGLAARLAEQYAVTHGGIFPYPVQIEAEVRNAAYLNGANDPQNDPNTLPIPIKAVSADGSKPMAIPTVELVVSTQPKGSGTIDPINNPYLGLLYDSIGAKGCRRTTYYSSSPSDPNVFTTTKLPDPGFSPYTPYGLPTKAILYSGVKYDIPPLGYSHWVVECSTELSLLFGITNSAEGSVVVGTPATANFSFEGVVQANPLLAAGAQWPQSAIKEVSAASGALGLKVSYASANTSSCQISRYYKANSSDAWIIWTYSNLTAPTSYSWPPTMLGSYYYWWHLTCAGVNGASGTQANFFLRVL